MAPSHTEDGGGIEWESEIEYQDERDYDRSAKGKLVIEGAEGKLIVLKRYRAMATPLGETTDAGHENDLMEPGEISEHSTYYEVGSGDPFSRGNREQITDGKHKWDVADETLNDREAFIKECRAALQADPAVEYEQHMEGDE
jgi:hypothetical protein